jgi:hypothetical protein
MEQGTPLPARDPDGFCSGLGPAVEPRLTCARNCLSVRFSLAAKYSVTLLLPKEIPRKHLSPRLLVRESKVTMVR